MSQITLPDKVFLSECAALLYYTRSCYASSDVPELVPWGSEHHAYLKSMGLTLPCTKNVELSEGEIKFLAREGKGLPHARMLFQGPRFNVCVTNPEHLRGRLHDPDSTLFIRWSRDRAANARALQELLPVLVVRRDARRKMQIVEV